MAPKSQSLSLRESQRACLIALRHRKETKTEIAIEAKLDLNKTAKALGNLDKLGLARRGKMNRWHLAARGKTCRFKIVPDRIRRNGSVLGPGARRLLEFLDRPMRGTEIAAGLGITLQRVHQLAVKLHVQKLVRLGDQERILEVVARVDDKTILLSRDEARVLSAIPDTYATNATKIRLAVSLPQKYVQELLGNLVANNFIAELDGFSDDTVYRIAAAGLQHPQRNRSGRRAQEPPLPVESDRVHAVLAAILDAQSLRIRDLKDALKIPLASINALMQYLKRKELVKKTSKELSAPYALTNEGLEILTEMERRDAA
jgi:predicted transcriptional regulator